MSFEWIKWFFLVVMKATFGRFHKKKGLFLTSRNFVLDCHL